MTSGFAADRIACMNNRIKVRFHLGNGPHKFHWQITDGNEVSYFKPDQVVIQMENCKLRNHRGVAERIHAGEHKTVCAWIECDSYTVYDMVCETFFNLPGGMPLRYNPKITPHWTNLHGENVDNTEYKVIYSKGKSLVY